MRLAFWALLALGFAGCTVFGVGPVLERVGGNWLAPSMVAGSVLGVAILALGVAFATGFRPSLLPTDASMLVALGALIASKVGIALLQSALTTATARG